MARLLDFSKVREDETEVEYLFGYPRMTRSLAIAKATAQGRPLVGCADADYMAILVKILRTWGTEGIWTEGGSYMA
jgi:hypothetical protein